MDWYSHRFARAISLTDHARLRAGQRGIPLPLLADLVEHGTARYKDSHRLWLYRHYPGRSDNLLCVAVSLEAAVVIKTVMHHWSPEESA
jgi:hypothetical protein